MRRSVDEATMYEYSRVRPREDVSWVLTQNSSLKHNLSQNDYNARFVYLRIMERVLAHELNYTPPISMPTSKLDRMTNMGMCDTVTQSYSNPRHLVHSSTLETFGHQGPS